MELNVWLGFIWANGLTVFLIRKSGLDHPDIDVPACQTGASWEQQPSSRGKGHTYRFKNYRLGFSKSGSSPG